MTKEIWKPIPDYEGLYEITLEGKVRSLNYLGRKGKIQEMKPGLINEYLGVRLSKEGRRKLFGIHQLLAITFLGHTLNGHTLLVDHINNNPLDNRLDNLQIISNRENTTKDKKRNLPTGVCFIPGEGKLSTKRYQVRIWIEGEKKYIGTFSTPQEASQAYQNALKNYERK